MTDNPSTAGQAVRRTVRYSGRVQGVGFRFTARETSAGFCVTGYVQNLDDGRVLMVAEGDAHEVERFCDALAAVMRHNIAAVNFDEEFAPAVFKGFTIRH